MPLHTPLICTWPFAHFFQSIHFLGFYHCWQFEELWSVGQYLEILCRIVVLLKENCIAFTPLAFVLLLNILFPKKNPLEDLFLPYPLHHIWNNIFIRLMFFSKDRERLGCKILFVYPAKPSQAGDPAGLVAALRWEKDTLQRVQARWLFSSFPATRLLESSKFRT